MSLPFPLALPADPLPSTPEERLSRVEQEVEREKARWALQRGARIYARACAACHGSQGRGDGPGAADLDPAPRDLTGGQIRFRSTPSGAAPRPEDLERTIRRGLPGTSMPGFGDLFSKDEIDDLIQFLYSLLAPGVSMDELPAPVEVRPAAEPTPATVAEGRGLFLVLECWTCHSVDGSGREASSMNLRVETGKPIRPPDFRYSPLKRGREPELIVRTLLTGLNGTPMPSYGDAMIFAREDVSDLSSLGGRLPKKAIDELENFVRTLPTQAEVAALGEREQHELRDRRLEALAHYVLSLDRRGSFWYFLLRERPEKEARSP